MIELPTTPSFRLDNREALVTGAYGSIGLGCSVALAEAGANVTISGKNNDKLNEVLEAFQFIEFLFFYILAVVVLILYG